MTAHSLVASLLALTAAASCAGAQACSSAVPEPARQTGVAPPGVQTPLPAPAPPPPRAPAIPEPAPPPGKELDLTEFRPLLSREPLAHAREACEAHQHGRCARRIRKYLEESPPESVDEPRWQLLLGTLYEQDEDWDEALAAYESSASGSWPLTDYALLGVARSLDALGKPERAAETLSRIPKSATTYAPAQLQLAELSCDRGAAAECIDHLETFLGLAHRPAGWGTRSFRVMRRLVRLLSTPRKHRAAIERQARALHLLRRLSNLAPNTANAFDAASLEDGLLQALPEEERVKHRYLTAREQLKRAHALDAGGRYDDAEQAADALIRQLGRNKYGPIACEALLLRGRSLSRLRRRTHASEVFEEVVGHCKSEDLRAWALYLLGKYAYQDDRFTDTERWMAQLEKEARGHRLADDGRLYRARAQLDMGVEARFSELLTNMPDDYPKGDMTLDGVFLLALNRMKKSDWAGAIPALERAQALVGSADLQRGTEWSGRERYFRARALVESGEREVGLSELEAIVAGYPLSYYMLHAYTRLRHEDPERGRRALLHAFEEAARSPFRIEHTEALDAPRLLRVMELFRQGDTGAARRELAISGALNWKTPDTVTWAIAQLYAMAGSARYSHAILRYRLDDWLGHWPSGSWARAWELAFPRPFLDEVTRQAEARDVEPQLLYAIMREESAFHEGAVSPADAYGLMQVIPATAKHFGKEAGVPYDSDSLVRAEVSITLGGHVVASYRDRFPDDPLLAIPAYNAGPGRPKRWLSELPGPDFDLWVELIPYRETRRYTKRVLAARAAYAFLYYRSDAVDPFLLPLKLHGSSANDVP